MDQDQERDYAEERYNAEFCPACGASPCGWDGRPDGFHTDLGEAELDSLATRIAYGVMLAAFAEYGITRLALARAALAVAVTPAIAPEHAYQETGDRR